MNKRPYFKGWYLKHQSPSQTLALIPSFHVDRDGQRYASLQIITEKGSWQTRFEQADIRDNKTGFYAHMGSCVFTEHGCMLQLEEKGLTLTGRLNYGPLTRPEYDIMGPFQYLPGMQCRHRIYSLMHRVYGILTLNGEVYDFEKGIGYIEGDSGHSFPENYLWTQYNSDSISIVIAAADIPVCGCSFTGCLASIWVRGREYRMATYTGAKVVCADEDQVVIRQGDLILRAELISKNAFALLAPKFGAMEKWIHESAACTVRYRWSLGERTLFDFTSSHASFEYL